MKKIVIAGGTGFLGLNLANYLLAKGYEVVLLSRNAPVAVGGWSHF